ncbi:hypothetical protein C8R44DRAFT_754899 [Mycena epipterygia]|nr:hypothetical protein C8R44DRAFT_754899 [Mycena epipterygia]
MPAARRPHSGGIFPTQASQRVAATAYASPRTTAHTAHRRPPARWLAQRRCDLPVHPRIISAARVPPRSTCALVNTVHPHRSLASHSVHRPELGSDDTVRTRAPLRALLRARMLALSSYAAHEGVPSAHESPRVARTPSTGTRTQLDTPAVLWSLQVLRTTSPRTRYASPARFAQVAATRTYSIRFRAHLRVYAVQIPAGENETEQKDE